MSAWQQRQRFVRPVDLDRNRLTSSTVAACERAEEHQPRRGAFGVDESPATMNDQGDWDVDVVRLHTLAPSSPCLVLLPPWRHPRHLLSLQRH